PPTPAVPSVPTRRSSDLSGSRSSSRRRSCARSWRTPSRWRGAHSCSRDPTGSAESSCAPPRRPTTTSTSQSPSDRRASVRGGSMKIVMFIGRRLIRLVLCRVAVSLLTFGLLQVAPGDFAGIQEAGGGNVSLAQQATSETRSELSDRYGAEVPIWQQYTTFMAGALTGDMGPSYRYPHRTVEGII